MSSFLWNGFFQSDDNHQQRTDLRKSNEGRRMPRSGNSQYILAQLQKDTRDDHEQPVMSLQETLDHFEVFKENAEKLAAQCAEYSQLIKTYEQQLDKHRKELNQTRTKLQQANNDNQSKSRMITDLQCAIAGKNKLQSKSTDPAEPYRIFLEEERLERRQEYIALQHAHGRAKNENTTLRKKLETATSDAASRNAEQKMIALEQTIESLTHRNSMLSFDLEYLKCVGRPAPEDSPPVQTTGLPTSVDTSNMTVPPTPFVLVLIDGDAYTWSSDLFAAKNLTANLTPGALAAHRMKLSIRNYIIQNPEQIPQEARIIVRVMSNPGTHLPARFEFMQNFTEAMPLFDYTNAGKGKERVDFKIHEWISLFIHNPACRKLFLAASTDNGFARCVEQYIHDEGARRKLCLISAGFVAAEIERLQLEDIEFPGVFARKLFLKPAVKKQRAEGVKTRRQVKAETAQRLSWISRRRAGKVPVGLWSCLALPATTVSLPTRAEASDCDDQYADGEID